VFSSSLPKFAMSMGWVQSGRLAVGEITCTLIVSANYQRLFWSRFRTIHECDRSVLRRNLTRRFVHYGCAHLLHHRRPKAQRTERCGKEMERYVIWIYGCVNGRGSDVWFSIGGARARMVGGGTSASSVATYRINQTWVRTSTDGNSNSVSYKLVLVFRIQ